MVNSRCELPVQILVVDLLRGPVLKSRVPTSAIVPELDIGGYVTMCVRSCRILSTVDSLVLQDSEERFSHRVIVANSGPAYRIQELMLLQRPGELAGCIVAAAIRMEYRLVGNNMVAGGHVYGLLDQRRLVVVIHRPAHNGLGVAVDDGGQIYPAFPGFDIRVMRSCA